MLSIPLIFQHIHPTARVESETFKSAPCAYRAPEAKWISLLILRPLRQPFCMHVCVCVCCMQMLRSYFVHVNASKSHYTMLAIF